MVVVSNLQALVALRASPTNDYDELKLFHCDIGRAAYLLYDGTLVRCCLAINIPLSELCSVLCKLFAGSTQQHDGSAY